MGEVCAEFVRHLTALEGKFEAAVRPLLVIAGEVPAFPSRYLPRHRPALQSDAIHGTSGRAQSGEDATDDKRYPEGGKI